jgi:hypothetical protein
MVSPREPVHVLNVLNGIGVCNSILVSVRPARSKRDPRRDRQYRSQENGVFLSENNWDSTVRDQDTTRMLKKRLGKKRVEIIQLVSSSGRSGCWD